MKRYLIVYALLVVSATLWAATKYNISGRVIDKNTRQVVAFALVKVMNTTTGVVTNEEGLFVITQLSGGTVRLEASSLGYKPMVSSEVMLGGKDLFVEIELEQSAIALQEVSVVVGPYRKTVESPIALRVIGFTEIQKSAGSGRDISRVVQSFPGVASSPSGYRNDLIVRGGGPSENRFFLDGIEVPNINHFSTQGASGGPVGLINADLIREVDFYSGAFPVNRGNALSSVLDFKLKDGSPDNNNFTAVLGTSEIGFSADGHIGKKTTYVASIRQSYLQFLFKALKLPFLPTFTDAQVKVKHRFDKKNELTVLWLGGLDDMVLNNDTVGQTDINKYTLTTLPVIKQFTYTIGAVYKHYSDYGSQTLVFSRNYLRNENFKHFNNDESQRRIIDLYSSEQEYKLRFENTNQMGQFRFTEGVALEYGKFRNMLSAEVYRDGERQPFTSEASIGVLKYGAFGSLQYESADSRLTSSLGLRMDGNNFNKDMANPLNQFSARLSGSYQLAWSLYVNGSAGIYYQMPSYTALGFTAIDGSLVNKDLRYQQSLQAVLGLEHRPASYARLTVEGFYKHYNQMPLSLIDKIPLASKGAEYGTVGYEPLSSTARGRAYGVEVLARWFGYRNLNFMAAYTWVRSEYISPSTSEYIPTLWDNRHLFTLTAGYQLPMNWEIGAKFRVVGPAPYTPFDKNKSSLIVAWDAIGRPYPDYSRYNAERLTWFNQLDVRIDKSFFFKRQMLSLFFDLQNALNSKYDDVPALINTGNVDPADPSRYILKEIPRRIGTIVPALGVIYKF